MARQATPLSTLAARTRRWRRRQGLLFGAGMLALAVIMYVFHPATQTRFATQQAAARFDNFELERLHVLPWSLSVSRLALEVDGLRVQLDDAHIGFNPLRLLFGLIHARDVTIEALVLDLRKVPPSDEPAAPFPGLFALLDQGVGLRIDELNVTGTVIPDDESGLTLALAGGGIAPGATGQLAARAELARTDGSVRVQLVGAASVAQDDDAHAAELGLQLDVDAQLAAAPAPLAFTLEATATPWREPALDDRGAPIDDVFEIVGDHLEVIVNSRPDAYRIALTGAFDARHQRLVGRHELEVESEVLGPYADTAALPVFFESGAGTYEVDLATLKITADYRGEAHIDSLSRVLGFHPDVPAELLFTKAFDVSIDAEQARVGAFELTLREPDASPVVRLALTDPLALALDAPLAALDPERVLAELAIEALSLTWLNGLMPETVFASGTFAGRFNVLGGGGGLRLTATSAPGVESAALIGGLGVPSQLSLAIDPVVSWQDDILAADLKSLTLMLDGEAALELTATTRTSLAGDDAGTTSVEAAGQLAINPLAALPLVTDAVEELSLPPDVALAFDGRFGLGAGHVQLQALEIDLTQADDRVLHASAEKAFNVALGEAGPRVDKLAGDLAGIDLADIDLGWLAPYVADYALSGKLKRAGFVISAGENGEFVAAPGAPLELRGVRVSAGAEKLVDDLALRISPRVIYTGDVVRVAYSGLRLALDGASVLSGDGSIALPLGGDEPAPISLAGRADVNLARVPQVAAALEAAPEHAWHARADYALTLDDSKVNIKRLRAALTVDGTAHVTLDSDGPLVVSTTVGPDAPLAGLVVGRAALRVSDVSSVLLGDVLALGGLAFDDLALGADVESDGRYLRAHTETPLTLTAVRVRGEEGDILAPFNFTVGGDLTADDDTLSAELADLALTFAAAPQRPALAGELDFMLEPGRPLPLRNLSATLNGFLPPLLAQPVLLPGHRLSDGTFDLEVTVDEAGGIDIGAALGNLRSDVELAISGADGRAHGQVGADGRGFGFIMPLSGRGRSGETTGRLVTTYTPGQDAPGLLAINFASEQFYLNDVLATVSSITAQSSTAQPEPRDDEAAPPPTAPVALDETPDKTAFWDVLPNQARFSYSINNLYYTDYLILNNVYGAVGITPERLTLESLQAKFHDSPLNFDGQVDFIPDTPAPYDLAMHGSVKQFDLNQFFSELVPGSKPRVEGLFSGSLDASGRSPNIGQYRNELLFDIKLASREGVFRPLPPDSSLIVGSSNVLGVVGEALSYMPTGGFGAGAVSRLVDYIQVIDYDRVDIQLERDETRDIAVRQFLVRSPNIRLIASGGIEHEYGKDVLDSPLTLDARLNMTGKGAAILYSLNLLEDGEDAFGYSLGPQFRIRGTPAAAESNFAEVVTTAADGAVKGGVTRPFAGLVGNVKHRWFGREPIAADAEEDNPAAAPADPVSGEE